MKPKRTRRHLLLALFSLLLNTFTVSADNINDSRHYLVAMAGLDQLRIEMPIYDDDGYDGFVDNGYVYITPTGGSKQTLLKFRTWEKDMSDNTPTVRFSKDVDGTMVLSRDQGYEDVMVTSTQNQCEVPRVPGKSYFKIYITWTVPASFRGKEFTITWKIHKEGNGPEPPSGESSDNISVNPSTWFFPAIPELIEPTLMDPMLGYDAAHAGQSMLIYTMPTNDIQKLAAHYTEVNGNQEVKRTKFLGNDLTGFIYLDADKCYKDFTIEAQYIDIEKRLRTSFSDSIVIPTLHQPYALSASLQPDGSARLQWRSRNNQWNDLMPDDTWEIQRNANGILNASAEWTSIGQVAFLNTDTTYTFIDNALLANYEGQPVYYRVRRASTATWDWQTGTYAQTSLPYVLQLAPVSSATVTQGKWDDSAHEANITFGIGGPEIVSGIYGRPNSGQFYVLRDSTDWKRFAEKVNNGERTLSAIMLADIDLGNCQTMIGTKANPYMGVFHGNGHTLTIRYKNNTESYIAPFRYGVDGAIYNLNVEGSIYTTKKYVAGLMASAGDGFRSFYFQNCRVSVSITCDFEGEAVCGGIVAHAPAGGIEIHNSVFDGRFIGPKANGFGGLVGFCEQTPTIVNCLFAPTRVDIDPLRTSCSNFCREKNPAPTATRNCYYLTDIQGSENVTIDGKQYLVLRNASDWNTFISKVMSANGNSDVNAIMANDFNVIYSVGYRSNIPYRGTFEGNGHTLGVSITSPDKEYIAPFSRTKDAVIRNLHVVGHIRGAMHAAGLVGSSEGSTLRIENCHVSANIYTTRTHAGGILGHGHKVKNYILNCLFDGIIEAQTYNSSSYAGAILGWEDGGTSNVVEGNVENATYTNVNHAGMNYNASSGGHVWGGSNNWNTHDWGECNKVGTLSSKELVTNLGDTFWHGFGTLVVPTMKQVEVEQGIYAFDIEPATLDTLLDKNQWQLAGNMPMPVLQVSKDKGHANIFWDKNAKVVLTINKSVDGKVRYTERRDLTPEEIAAGKIKVELTTPCVDNSFQLIAQQGASQLTPLDTIGFEVIKTEKGEAARYQFNNNVEVSELQATTLQSEVSLTWTVKGTGDFFCITRQDKATQKTDTLEHAYSMNTYVDKTPKPQHVYTYKVEGVNDCEGRHVSSVTADGWCKPTGVVRGYLRLRDGTAIAGRRVTAEPLFNGGEARSDTTDATGFFEIDGLVYTGQGSYKITAERTGEEGTITDYTANFSEDSNVDAKAVLFMDEYFLLTGYVMYEGTSVPVIGAQFERDGEVVHNGSGKPIITDTQGRFSISMPKGTHSVRVVKDGHVFLDQGFYLDEKGKSDVSWQKSVHDYVFWDQTRVMLQGRVVGGEVQGNKPLGVLASANNLGDSLTIVMQLEGDNASWLVRDQLNASITERHQDFRFGTAQKDSCHMDTYRHRLVIKPSPETGEYNVPMLPVKYKVTEIYAEGYPTLFQAGKVGETLDLSEYVDKDVVTYSRIYRAAPTLDVRQFNMLGEGYMGIKSYTAQDITGKEVSIELWNDSVGYSFGHPVYMANSPIIMMLSAVEKYYRNNNPKVNSPDIVRLPGGEVRIQNALIAADKTETIKLDSVGEAIYRFTPQNLTFTNEDDMALKTLTMTLLYDDTYYDVLPMNGEPIRGYVMAAKAKSQGRRAVAEGPAVLVDILRDPPGATSSAYIESGSKLSYTFSENMKLQLGVKVTFGRSSGNIRKWSGVWSGIGTGTVIGDQVATVKTEDNFTMSFLCTYYNAWQYAYTLENTERISTSSSTANVGADADVFIGMMRSGIMEDGIAVRAIDEDTYKLLTTRAGGTYTIDDIDFKVPQGTMKLLAEGKDSKGKKVYLVRDEVLTYRSEVTSTFVHSQRYIEKELIPELFNLRNTFILPMGTKPETAKEVAKQKGYAMYISTVPADSETFGLTGYYTPVAPDDEHTYSDSVAIINSRISTWVEFLATNEKEKLEASDLVKRYDVDGRSSITYSESFSTSLTESRYFQIPLAGTGVGSVSFGPGMTAQTANGKKTTQTQQEQTSDPDEFYTTTMDFDVFGVGLYAKFTPVFSFDYNYNYGKSESHSKKVGFTLAPSGRSNLVVEVYRSRMDKDEIQARVDSLKKMGISGGNAQDLFFQYTTDEYIRFVRSGGVKGQDYGVAGSLNGLSSYVESTPTQYRSLFYRTRGGATCEPYEDERRTKFYSPGIVLDAKTIEIDRPRIWVEQASVSNVPFDEPARFTLHIVNESEVPAQATTVNPFLIYLDPASNAKGAKVFVDGHPLAGGGLSLLLNPNQVVTKTVEFYPGTEYDYDDIILGIKDPLDPRRWWNCNISAHFVPVAGKVNISLPGDKWVVNTESQYDSNRQQYYMPVRIDGFDVNYRNFDHIELQYKLSTQGDRDWVNVCSYYNDSLLMAKATGECKLIEDDGRIMATFWGESDPIEQQYDLRAVNYCRYGNGFLTRSSNILTGVKDTRRPQLFGTPKPEDGILDIGDDILLRFSEPIAGNYLRGLNNFQILGQTNSTNISLSTDLRFDGEGGAQSMSSRNLAGKSFTVEMIISPDRTENNMTLFSHGQEEQFLELGVTSGWRLSAVFADDVILSDPIDFNGLRQVAFVVEADVEAKVTKVSFYDGTRLLGTKSIKGLYGGTGAYALGVNQHVNNQWECSNYEGEMLEFRLWNRALSLSEMNEYGQKRLTGYELGLMDNFPLNEGQGIYSYNRVPSGGDLSLLSTTAAWKVPDGIGLKLDGSRGFRIDPQKFSRTDYQDYTLMFWFRTTDDEGTLLSNGPAQTEADARNHFNFGVSEGKLLLRLGGRELPTFTSVNNGAWHHAALTVSRSRNVGNLFVDNALRKTFAIDTIGGILGSYLAAGATYLSDEKVERPINGHIDEICMYEMALTENILKSTAAMTPTGEELGLMAYLNFGRNELQQNNQQYLMPTGISLKRYRDWTTGELTTQRDTLIAQEVVDRLADKTSYAPMRGQATLENIPYSFVADGKDLLINLDLPDYQIEKTNVMVTVKDVTDLNGNTMASPVTMDLYIYRNPLRWTAKQLSMGIDYGEEHTFEATVQNLSGRSKRFTIQGLPVWITASQYEGVVSALGEQVITFTVSPSINMGDFDETIYLAGEDGMSEPLPVMIKVRGEKPDWAVDQELLRVNNAMSIVAKVEINDNVAHDADDILAAFDSDHRLLGLAHVDVPATGAGNEGLFYLNVYNIDLKPIELFFEFFDASTGTIHKVMPSMDELTFKKDTVVGTTADPVRFFSNNAVVQAIPLKKGWNWISFNVSPVDDIVKKVLNNSTKWEVGDLLEIERPNNERYLISYKNIADPDDDNNFFQVWDYENSILFLDPGLMYRFYSNSDKLAYVSGFLLDDLSISVRKGWNRIGYLSKLNLPIGTALAEYTDQASAGDIIKSQSEFAVLSVDASGNKSWKGTLKYLRAGEGYMLKRNADSEVTFSYPEYYSSSRYSGHEAPRRAPVFQNNSGISMTVVAAALGIDVQPGDRLTAYRDGEVCGVSEADADGVFYLNVGDTHHSSTAAPQLTFVLERDDELLGVTTRSEISFAPDAAYGTPEQPTAISFLSAGNLDADGWYDISGRKVINNSMKNDKLHRGVYIHKNQKVIIK